MTRRETLRLEMQTPDCLSKPIALQNAQSTKTELFDNREWLNAEDTASYLGTSVGAVRNMTSNGVLPHYKLGRRVRYRVDELRALLLKNKRGGIYHGD